MRACGLTALLLIFSHPGMAMDIVAHRGASHRAPENTLPAYRLAWELGADAAECDVRLTADDRVVVIHDPDTGRVAGSERIVAEQPYASLKALDVGAARGEKYAGTHIPLLSELLAALPPGKTLLVEIKCGPEILDRLTALIAASGKGDQIVLISFHPDVLIGAKKRMPRAQTILLRKAPVDAAGDDLAFSSELIAQAKESGFDGLGLDDDGVKAGFVQAARRAGLAVFVWTVDAPERARRLRSMGIDGLITNRPGWMREQLQGGGSSR